MVNDAPGDSTSRGPPLADEPLGAQTLGGFLREVCREYADREALVFLPPDGPAVRLSYAAVWDQAVAVARALVARGVTKDTRVGLLATNRPEWISSLFGIALAGGTCVALSTFVSTAELDYQLRVGDVSLLIFERSILKRDFAAELWQLRPDIAAGGRVGGSASLPFLKHLVCLGDAPPAIDGWESWSDFLQAGAVTPMRVIDAIAAEITPGDRAMVFFSSGSTARPKPILHAHRAAAIQCWRWRRIFGLTPDVRTWSANALFWSGNFSMALGSTFGCGGCLVLQRFFDPGEALRLMAAERVSMPIAWPHQWPRLVEDPAYPTVDLSALRYVGEASPLRKHPTVRSNWVEPLSVYGNTETFTLITGYPSDAPAAEQKGNHGPPLPGAAVRIVDPDTGRVLARGESGEIAVKGPTLMLGYLRTVTEEVFDDEGFFHTGDGGFVDERGRLHWHGRLNDLIKTGGANVSPLEIDEVLAGCPGVKIAVTVGVPHATLGEMVVACVVPESGASLDESAVRSFVSGRLSSYKVPRRVLFLTEADLTMTGSSKVKTAALREWAGRRLTPG